jgi:hypothetical protein
MLGKRSPAPAPNRPPRRHLFWARLRNEERLLIISYLGAALDKELPKGQWWPLLKMMCELRSEGWKQLTPRIRLRLEKLIVNDVLAGHV